MTGPAILLLLTDALMQQLSVYLTSHHVPRNKMSVCRRVCVSSLVCVSGCLRGCVCVSVCVCGCVCVGVCVSAWVGGCVCVGVCVFNRTSI